MELLRRVRTGAAIALVGLAAAGTAPALEGEPNLVYEFDATLAPVCIDGDLPLRLEVEGGYLDGTLTASTDVRGRITGDYAVGSDSFAVTGKIKHRDTGSTLKLVAKGNAGRITFKGGLEQGAVTGSTSGKGAVAPGKNTFTLDVSDAPATVVTLAVVIPPGTGTTLKGGGTATVRGVPLEIKSTRSLKKGFRLVCKGGPFRWTGTASSSGDPVSIAWTAKGWGAKASGAPLDIALVPPPSGIVYADPSPLFEAEEPAAPDLATVGGGPVKTWTVEPALPAGLVLDAASGAVSGVPESPAETAVHLVTAANLAGSTTTSLTVTVRGNRAWSFEPEQKVLTDDDFRHFLSRTHFGVRQAELDAVMSAGLDAYLDDQLDFRSGTAIEAEAFEELVNPTDPPGLEGGFPSAADLSSWWLRIMIDTDRPMQEHIAMFWHDRIPASWAVLGAGYTHFLVDYANLFRHRGTGNLRDLLLDVSRDPAMLVYLSGYENTKNAPNENYAREFWELFTLGVDNGYTQEDIEESARAFTGWRFRYDPATGRYSMQFDPNRHDAGAKTILGSTIAGQNATDDFAAVVDITLANRPVAEFITARIFEEYCYESPPPELVADMAKVLRDANWELKPFFMALFRSEAFWSSRSRLPRVKSPLEFGVGIMRSTGLKLSIPWSFSFLYTLGHVPGNPPTVNGWPTGTLWFSADGMVNRINYAWYVVLDQARQAGVGIDIADILPPVPERTDEAVLETLEGLMDLDLSGEERTALLGYMNTQRMPDGSVVPSAFDGSSQAHLDERVRGLVYILAQHPSFNVK